MGKECTAYTHYMLVLNQKKYVKKRCFMMFLSIHFNVIKRTSLKNWRCGANLIFLRPVASCFLCCTNTHPRDRQSMNDMI
jgi:hypothetical protein